MPWLTGTLAVTFLLGAMMSAQSPYLGSTTFVLVLTTAVLTVITIALALRDRRLRREGKIL